MKTLRQVLNTILVFLFMAISVRAADDINIERMATCQDSWFEWKNDPSKLENLAKYIMSNFVEKENSAFLVPKSEISAFGLKVVQLFPGSIGMAVGFSAIVEADFKTTRESLEKRLNKSFKKCETGDNMLTCELEIGEKRPFFYWLKKTEKLLILCLDASITMRNNSNVCILSELDVLLLVEP